MRAVDNAQKVSYTYFSSLDRVNSLGLRVRLAAIFDSGLDVRGAVALERRVQQTTGILAKSPADLPSVKSSGCIQAMQPLLHIQSR